MRTNFAISSLAKKLNMHSLPNHPLLFVQIFNEQEEIECSAQIH